LLGDRETQKQRDREIQRRKDRQTNRQRDENTKETDRKSKQMDIKIERENMMLSQSTAHDFM